MTYPPAACEASHSRTYRSMVPVRFASSAGVCDPPAARPLYSPSLSPMMHAGGVEGCAKIIYSTMQHLIESGLIETHGSSIF